MTNDDDEDLDMDEEDILSIFPEERYNPSALEKMISTVSVLLEESRDEGYEKSIMILVKHCPFFLV